MIRATEVNDLIEIDELINGLKRQFRPAQREMRLGLHDLCRGIKDRVPGYLMPPRKHYAFPNEIMWIIKELLESQWHQNQFLVPASDMDAPALVMQTSALIAAEKTSYARRQGLRFAAAHTLTELRECIAEHTNLLYRGMLIPAGDVRINAYDFSAVYRFWQQVWSEHGIAGLTIAFIIWREYFEKIISHKQCLQAAHFKDAPGVKASIELEETFKLFQGVALRKQIQTGLILTGTLCYRTGLAEDELRTAVLAPVIDYLKPSLLGALRTFGPAELRKKIDETDMPATAQQCLQDSELLALVVLFGELDWATIEQLLAQGIEARKTVSQILGSSLALKRMANNDHYLNKALEQAQKEGLLPDDLNVTMTQYLHADNTVSKVGRKVMALSR